MSGDRRQISFKKLLLNPGILAVLTGIVIFVCSIELPTIILQPIHYFSALNVPVPMVISGYYLSKADLRTRITTSPSPCVLPSSRCAASG